MKRLNICVDIDGTMTEPYYWLKKANEHFKTNLLEEDVKEYDIHHVLKIERSDYLSFYNMYGASLHRESKPREHVCRVLNDLAKHHNIFYVTAREEGMREVTEAWFMEHNMPQAPLYLLGSHHKVKKAKELKCDLFLEDKFENAIELAMADVKVLLIDCTYNRFATILDTERVYSWLDIEKKVNFIANQHDTRIKIA